MSKGVNYEKEELGCSFDAVKEIFPISSTAWGSVAKTHMARYPDKGWTVESLKRKFKELHNKIVPIRDPLCPPAVHRAKQIRRAIIDKMDGSKLNSEEGDGNEELVVPPCYESDEDDNLINSNKKYDDDGKFGVGDAEEVDGTVQLVQRWVVKAHVQNPELQEPLLVWLQMGKVKLLVLEEELFPHPHHLLL
jgi:hypothetical protein